MPLLMLGGMPVALLAQSAESLSGGAGWVGAGLLGAVLGWLLLKHLPDKDKQIKEFVQGKDDHVKALADEFRRELKETRIEYRAALESVLGHCRQEMETISATLKEELGDMRHVIRDFANVAGLQVSLARAQAHKAAGGPPGSIVVETPPATLPPAGG